MLFEFVKVAFKKDVGDDLKRVARAVNPSVSEERLDDEVVVFLLFLLFQACKQIFSNPDSLRRLGEQVKAFVHSCMGANADSIVAFQKARYWEYVDPFEADMERLPNDPPGAIHWRFLVQQFIKNFNPDQKIEDVSGAIRACLSVGAAFVAMLRFVKDYGSA